MQSYPYSLVCHCVLVLYSYVIYSLVMLVYENVMNFHAPEKGKGSFVSNGNVYQIEETKDANNNTIIRIIPPTQKDVVTVTLSDMQED